MACEEHRAGERTTDRIHYGTVDGVSYRISLPPLARVENRGPDAVIVAKNLPQIYVSATMTQASKSYLDSLASEMGVDIIRRQTATNSIAITYREDGLIGVHRLVTSRDGTDLSLHCQSYFDRRLSKHVKAIEGICATVAQGNGRLSNSR